MFTPCCGPADPQIVECAVSSASSQLTVPLIYSQGSPLFTPWGLLDPLMVEFIASSVSVDFYTFRVALHISRIHDIWSRYSTFHSLSLRSFDPRTVELVAYSVTKDCYETHGFRNFRSGYIVGQSLWPFAPSNSRVCQHIQSLRTVTNYAVSMTLGQGTSLLPPWGQGTRLVTP